MPEIKVNPEYAELVPMLTHASFEALSSSIKTQGLHEPITVNEKMIVLDGHNRLRACQKLGITCDYKVRRFENQLQEKLYVIDVNLQRRQLNTAQRVALSLKKKPIYEELARLNESLGGKGVKILTPLNRVNEVIAKDAGVSRMQVSKLENIFKTADNQLKDRVLAGRTSIDKAYNQIKLQERRDKLILASKKAVLESDSNRLRYELFQGDFRELSKKTVLEESISLIFTDPPYDYDSLYLYEHLAMVAARVLKPGGSLVTYSGGYYNPEVFDHVLRGGNGQLRYWWNIAVKYNGSIPFSQDHKVYINWKSLFWFVKGKRIDSAFPLNPFADFIESKAPDKSMHEWAQSAVEAQQVISNLTFENDTVFDPMMGSGTTGIAALNLKRKFLGFDIDPEAVQTARANLKTNG